MVPQDEPSRIALSYAAKADTNDHSYTAVSASSQEHGEKTSHATETALQASDSPTKPRLYAQLQKQWVDGWAAEIVSCALSVLALACLVAILRYFDGYVVTKMPLKISINTLVAVIAAVIKSSLLLPVAGGISQSKWLWFSKARSLIDFEHFDSASRGPWGSLRLVFRLQSRHVAALGAWITVLAIAIDPFSQQIIHPIVCHETLQGVVANVPRANNLTGVGTLAVRSEPISLDANTTVAIFIGLLKDPETISVQCLTGNCTFSSDAASGATYQTLGFNSTCVDVSAEIKKNDTSPPQWYIPAIEEAAARTGNSTYRASWLKPVLTMSNASGTYFPAYWSSKHVNSSLFSYAAILDSSECKNNLTNSCPVPLAVECRMWPVIQTVKSRIEVSKLEETVLSSEPLQQYYSPQYFMTEYNWMTISSKVLRNGNWESCDPSPSFTPRTPVAIANNTLIDLFGKSTSPGAQWYADDCVWSIDSSSVSALRSTLGGMFYNKYLGRGSGGGGRDGVGGIVNGELWIRNLWHNGTASLSSAEAYTARLARSLTVHTRQRASLQDPDLGFAHGSAVKTETCIQIRWGWISFPISLVLFTIVFLAATIWKTKKSDHLTRQHGHWKSSNLALLFGGLEDGLRHGTRVLEKRSDMNESARLLKVSLSLGDDGWRLR
ncbi:hypothetical protein GQ44DRAFT_770257 [Phaeosphaeriaceae sp. PMI808]|nr:hypothetical protein GQ44DRAFT_770257 [Phaeosphaeriaceae sp. PMI808]